MLAATFVAVGGDTGAGVDMLAHGDDLKNGHPLIVGK
jgi:hypothetical protein